MLPDKGQGQTQAWGRLGSQLGPGQKVGLKMVFFIIILIILSDKVGPDTKSLLGAARGLGTVLIGVGEISFVKLTVCPMIAHP